MATPITGKQAHALPGRVLFEDDDFITMEIAKHPGVTFNLEPYEPDHPQQFFTLMFVHAKGEGRLRRIQSWLPWA